MANVAYRNLLREQLDEVLRSSNGADSVTGGALASVMFGKSLAAKVATVVCARPEEM